MRFITPKLHPDARECAALFVPAQFYKFHCMAFATIPSCRVRRTSPDFVRGDCRDRGDSRAQVFDTASLVAAKYVCAARPRVKGFSCRNACLLRSSCHRLTFPHPCQSMGRCLVRIWEADLFEGVPRALLCATRDVSNCEGFRMPAHAEPRHASTAGRRPKASGEGTRGEQGTRDCTTL